ncbi:10455_t:CDS:1, partial [Cetraspora pellucida]
MKGKKPITYNDKLYGNNYQIMKIKKKKVIPNNNKPRKNKLECRKCEHQDESFHYISDRLERIEKMINEYSDNIDKF